VVAVILLPVVASVAGTLLLVVTNPPSGGSFHHNLLCFLNTLNLALGVYSNVSDAEYHAAWFAYRATANLPTGFGMSLMLSTMLLSLLIEQQPTFQPDSG